MTDYPQRDTSNDLQAAVVAVLGAVARGLPRACAEVQADDSTNGHVRYRGYVLRPTGSPDGRAELTVEIPEAADVLYIGFGKDSRFEIAAGESGWLDGRFSSHLDQLEAVATAVTQGKLTEETWVRGGEILKSQAVLDLPDGPFVVSARHTLLPRWGCAHRTLRYRPYCAHDSGDE